MFVSNKILTGTVFLWVGFATLLFFLITFDMIPLLSTYVPSEIGPGIVKTEEFNLPETCHNDKFR